MMGRNVEVGYVTTRYFGPAALFQIDVPGIEEHEETLARPEYVGTEGSETWTPAGSVVKRPAIASRTSMIGPSTIYRLTPCSEEVAKAALSERRQRAVAVVSLATNKTLTAGESLPGEPDFDVEDEDEEPEDIGNVYSSTMRIP
jgi:hypothetical protein